jgi:pimeloyl-ACP methyl ester carboxylesterase
MLSILLIPGNMCDERLWHPVAEQLIAAGHRVEHSPRLDQPSIAEMAEAVLSAAKVPVVAIGFSMGAIVAAEMARRAPETITALGLVAFVAQSETLRQREDLRPTLSKLEMPVMLACGSEDRLCPPDWHRQWAESIGPNAMFIEIEEAGHLLPLEQSHMLADALIGWLAKEAPCQTAF